MNFESVSRSAVVFVVMLAMAVSVSPVAMAQQVPIPASGGNWPNPTDVDFEEIEIDEDEPAPTFFDWMVDQLIKGMKTELSGPDSYNGPYDDEKDPARMVAPSGW